MRLVVLLRPIVAAMLEEAVNYSRDLHRGHGPKPSRNLMIETALGQYLPALVQQLTQELADDVARRSAK